MRNPRVALREAVLASLGTFELYRDQVLECSSATSPLEKELIALGLKHAVVTRADLTNAVANRIGEIGTKMAKQSAEGEWADSVISADALAFAIQRRHLSPATVEAIRFDHGATADTFMRGRVDDLPERVLRQLIGDTKPDVRYHANDEQPRQVETG